MLFYKYTGEMNAETTSAVRNRQHFITTLEQMPMLFYKYTGAVAKVIL